MPSLNNLSDNNIISSSTSPELIYAWYSNGTLFYYSDSLLLYTNEEADFMFYYLKNINSFELYGIDTSKTKNMESMFRFSSDQTGIISLFITNLDTSNATSLRWMFANFATKAYSLNINCLKKLDLKNAESIQLKPSDGSESNLYTLDIYFSHQKLDDKFKIHLVVSE